jgi:pectate lyase
MNTRLPSHCGLFACLTVAALVGCSGSDSSGPGAAGGTNSAGSPGTGGLLPSGGLTGTGGASDAAGAISAGGTSAVGGSAAATGGAPATGGGAQTGGTTGGTNVTGGAPASGGSSSAGTVATGGSRAAGGTTSLGGTSASGGATAIGGTSMGGSNTTGGTTAAGGTKTTGGATAAGGTTTTGGTKATGGTVATGGTAATGGKATGGAATGGSGGASNCSTPPAPSALVGWAAVSGNGVSTTTGGGNATPQTVTTLAALNSAAAGTASAVIYVTGVLASGAVNIGSNKTIVGLCGAELHGTVNINGSSNVIVRNIKIVGYNCSDSTADCSAGADAVHVTAQAHHIWFDHDDISDGSDGNFDINQASDFTTVSWTKFHYSSARTDPVAGASGHRYSNLIGSADNTASDVGFLNTTFHHNWWADNVDQRMPRVRYGKIHVFNNLYTTIGNNYCVGVGADASVRVENNVFIGVTRPVNSGSTGFANANTTLTIAGNIYTNTNGANSADIGVAFNPTYPFTMDAASAVEAAVRAGAGPQ